MSEHERRAKEGAGDLTGDDCVQREGKIDRASGTIKDKVGDGADKAMAVLSRDNDK